MVIDLLLFVLGWHFVGLIVMLLVRKVIADLNAEVSSEFEGGTLAICLPVVAIIAGIVIIFDKKTKEESE